MLLAGIDGGGTKTKYVLCGEDGTVLRQVVGRGTNPNQTGFDVFSENITVGLTALLKDTDAAGVSLYAGLAGGTTGDNAERTTALIKSLFPGIRAENGSDAMNALYLGLGSGDGIAVIAGTGSSSYVRCEGEISRVGGWGYLLDPSGSGYAMGRDAIFAALSAEDGSGAPSLLTELVERRLGTKASVSLGRFYSEGKEFIASFAPEVFKAYSMGDRQAADIIRDTARYIAKLINTGGRKFGGKTVDVALCGGLFSRAYVVLPMIQDALETPCRFIIPTLPPVYGAVRKAAEMCGVVTGEEFEKRFEESLAAAEAIC